LGDLPIRERQHWLELLSYIQALVYHDREVPERERLREVLVARTGNAFFPPRRGQTRQNPAQETPMSPSEITVQGTLHPDGTLQLDEKPNLPPGRVSVVLRPVPELPDDDPFWAMMKEIWAGQQARGHVPRSVEEVEAERQQTRDEWEERMREIERIQEESRRLREQGP
jgi:hypothetical protein